MTLYFDDEYNLGEKLPFDENQLLNRVINTCIEYEGFPSEVEISVSFVEEAEMQSINNETRGIDRVTDVLSFPMIDFSGVYGAKHIDYDSVDYNPETNDMLMGDIVLCIPKVFSQAEEYDHSVKREYAFLIVHSMLHLMGYDHIEEPDRIIMEEKQKGIMAQLMISRKE